MTQLYSLLIEIKTSFGNLTANKRMEIASYFVPEVIAIIIFHNEEKIINIG